jgi:hypothetical protein
MRLSQNESGRAFEYRLAVSLSNLLTAKIEDNSQIQAAQKCFEKADNRERERIVKASDEAARFLFAHDNRLKRGECSIKLQSDQLGRLGDVRDIVIRNNKISEEIGISAKHRHFAIKHSRLSEQIDFGWDWFGVHCSQEYFQKVTPLFKELRIRQRTGEKWRDIKDKRQRYYLPVLNAFRTEIERLFSISPQVAAEGLVHYLLGHFDYYKVIKEDGEVSITSFNISGTLKWGNKIPLPKRLIEISQKPKSDTTLIAVFDRGWQISLRIHNASTAVEPSLKFDINLVGMPSEFSRNEIKYTG